MAPLRTSYKSKPFELLRRGEHHCQTAADFGSDFEGSLAGWPLTREEHKLAYNRKEIITSNSMRG